MFEKGEYIIYGNSGVCEVQDYLKADGEHRTYYVLAPVGSKGSTIFSPVDNQKVSMRKVMTKEEADALLKGISGEEEMVIRDARTQEQQYKEVLQSGNSTEALRLLRALYKRKKQREAAGRRVTAIDEKYYFMAKGNLLNELAIALNVKVEEAERLLAEQIKKGEREQQ